MLEQNQPAAQSMERVLRWTALLWVAYQSLLALLDAVSLQVRQGMHPLSRNYYLAHIVVGLILLALVFVPQFERWLGKAFMPVVVAWFTITPVLITSVLLPKMPAGPLVAVPGFQHARNLPFLWAGLGIISWHYRWRVVIAYTAVIAVVILASGLHSPSTLPTLTVITILIVANFLIFSYCVSVLIRRIRNQQTALIQANLQLRHHATTLEHLTISRERNRVARELHDTLAHTLSGLTVQLETIKAYAQVDSAAVQPMIATALGTARNGLQETRRALKALRVSPLDDLGLVLALRTLVETAAEPASLQLRLDLPAESPVLAPDVEQVLYRVTQEAVANVVQHAAAHTLTVRLASDEQQLTLMIQDDGRGFAQDSSVPAGHFGLLGIRERVALVGGESAITSKPGVGTTIMITIPW